MLHGRLEATAYYSRRAAEGIKNWLRTKNHERRTQSGYCCRSWGSHCRRDRIKNYKFEGKPQPYLYLLCLLDLEGWLSQRQLLQVWHSNQPLKLWWTHNLGNIRYPWPVWVVGKYGEGYYSRSEFERPCSNCAHKFAEWRQPELWFTDSSPG